MPQVLLTPAYRCGAWARLQAWALSSFGGRDTPAHSCRHLLPSTTFPYPAARYLQTLARHSVPRGRRVRVCLAYRLRDAPLRSAGISLAPHRRRMRCWRRVGLPCLPHLPACCLHGTHMTPIHTLHAYAPAKRRPPRTARFCAASVKGAFSLDGADGRCVAVASDIFGWTIRTSYLPPPLTTAISA